MVDAPNIIGGRSGSAARLSRALQAADERMAKPRKFRLDMLKQYAGPFYGHRGPDKAEPLNTFGHIVMAMLPKLQLDPSSEVAPRIPEYGPFAALFELEIDRVCEEIRLGDSYMRLILDAMFGVGISYTGWTAGPLGELYESEGHTYDAGEPFMEVISLDNYVPDPWATHREAFSFEADRLRVNREVALNQSDLWSRSAVERLPIVGHGSSSDSDRAEQMSRKPNMASDNWLDEIEVMRVWLADERMIVTLPADGDATEYLSETEWDGDEAGPYDDLSLMQVPDNSIPVSYLGVVWDLHEARNKLMRKMLRQTERQKDVTLYPAEREEDAKNVQAANDGGMVGVNGDPKDFQTVRMGGANPEGPPMLALLDHHANRQVGNPDALGGLESQSDTLGQDQMLFANASDKIGFWRKRIREHARRVLGKIADFVWNDDTRADTLVQKVGFQANVMEWLPGVRLGNRDDYRVMVRDYSIASDTPEQQYARTMAWAEKVAIPLMQAGGGLDPRALLEITGELGDVPGLERLLQAWAAAVDVAGRPGGQRQGDRISVNMGGRAMPGPQAPQVLRAFESATEGV